jgi:hypothetical protein
MSVHGCLLSTIGRIPGIELRHMDQRERVLRIPGEQSLQLGHAFRAPFVALGAGEPAEFVVQHDGPAFVDGAPYRLLHLRRVGGHGELGCAPALLPVHEDDLAHRPECRLAELLLEHRVVIVPVFRVRTAFRAHRRHDAGGVRRAQIENLCARRAAARGQQDLRHAGAGCVLDHPRSRGELVELAMRIDDGKLVRCAVCGRGCRKAEEAGRY